MTDAEASELRKYALEHTCRSRAPEDVLADLPQVDKLARWLMTGELPPATTETPK